MNKRDYSQGQQSHLLQAFFIQKRVVGALLLREIITRYGRNNVGFMWLLLEPMIFCVGVVILWNTIHKDDGFRVAVTPFIVTGYSCLLLWRNCPARGIKAIEPNRSLLHHRPVKIIDIFIARMMLEIAGVTAAFITVSLAMIGLDLMALPKDLGLIIGGWFYMAWFSACLGTILGCLSEHGELVERLWHPIGYFLLAVSGTFFMVDWLPHNLQQWVLLVPMVHPIEMIRAGYWGDSPHFHYSIWYISIVCLSMSLLALLLMADKRMKMLT